MKEVILTSTRHISIQLVHREAVVAAIPVAHIQTNSTVLQFVCGPEGNLIIQVHLVKHLVKQAEDMVKQAADMVKQAEDMVKHLVKQAEDVVKQAADMVKQAEDMVKYLVKQAEDMVRHGIQQLQLRHRQACPKLRRRTHPQHEITQRNRDKCGKSKGLLI
jgi:gas vesicle protein